MNNTHVQLAGSGRPTPQRASKVGPIDPTTIWEVTVALEGPPLPGPGAMPATALTRARFDQLYGVPADDVRKVETVLRSYGLKTIVARQGGRSLRVRGEAGAMMKAFQPDMAMFESPGEGQFRARSGFLMVPRELQGLITGVFGLDQRRMARRRNPFSRDAARGRGGPPPLTPADLERLYNFPRDEGGQRIAIAEFGQEMGGGGQALPPAYIPADVAAFCARHHRPTPTVRVVNAGLKPLSGAQFDAYQQQLTGQLLDLLIGQTGETMMDVEIVAALCPRAEISVYFARWGEGGWIDLLDEVTAGAQSPVTLSISYGLAEEAPDWSDGAMDEIDKRLQIAAMLGVTVCVSSGDDGSGCGMRGVRCHVNFPASSQYVLSVGGTMMADTGEVVWWEAPGRRLTRRGGASGGGVSARHPRPPWQPAGVTSLNQGAPAWRVVPDVMALAGAPYYALMHKGALVASGGTSAATPVWASLIARIDAALPPRRRQRFVPRLLYGAAVAQPGFRDIAHGGNVSHPSPGRGYEAAAGFDAASGLGVPDGQRLLDLL